jgi:hypothetical protein
MDNLIEKAEARIKEDKDYLKSVMKVEYYNELMIEGNMAENLKKAINNMEYFETLKRRQKDALGDIINPMEGKATYIERELKYRISLYQILLDLENEVEHLKMTRETYDEKFHHLASDLMANRFHPKNFNKWNEWGFDDGFEFVEG